MSQKRLDQARKEGRLSPRKEEKAQYEKIHIDFNSPYLTKEENNEVDFVDVDHHWMREMEDAAFLTRGSEMTLNATKTPDLRIEDKKKAVLSDKLHRVLLEIFKKGRMNRDRLAARIWCAGFLRDAEIYPNGKLQYQDLTGKHRSRNFDDLFGVEWVAYTGGFDLMVGSAKPTLSLLSPHFETIRVDPWLDRFEKMEALSPLKFKERTGVEGDRICEWLTGNTDPLINKLWCYHLIGAVKRTFKPGSQLDTMAILISPQQGYRKSSLLQAMGRLPGEEIGNEANFVSVQDWSGGKDSAELLQGKRIVNLDECDSSFRGAAASKLKQAITTTTDTYRKAYAIEAASHPRTCAFFGTSNHPNLIQSMNGERRFIPITVWKKTEFEWLSANWDNFWGFYKWCYLEAEAGRFQYYAADPEIDALRSLQKEHKDVPAYLETLDALLEILEVSDGSFCFLPSDILAVLSREIGTAKPYHKDQLITYLEAERGYEFKRPTRTDGTKPSKNRLVFGKNPRELSRAYLEVKLDDMHNGRLKKL